MSTGWIAKKSVTIQARPEQVWDALTNPALIKEYFFGTEAISDWKVGSSLVFKGIWEGKPYEDHGTILALDKGKFLKYNYWSSFSGTEDKAENYAIITYTLTPDKSRTVLTITQDNCPTAEARDHSVQNWGTVLDNLVKLLMK
jgi:uncharacterized protein YndB with AHSA1/START domain